jgi:hypothetical protein
MSLKNFEMWIEKEKLKASLFILPLDRILVKLGFTGAPLIYKSYLRLSLILSLFFFVGFPLLLLLFLSLIFLDVTWLTQSVDLYLWAVLPSVFVVSFPIGLILAFFLKRTAKKYSIPPWQTFTRNK